MFSRAGDIPLMYQSSEPLKWSGWEEREPTNGLHAIFLGMAGPPGLLASLYHFPTSMLFPVSLIIHVFPAKLFLSPRCY